MNEATNTQRCDRAKPALASFHGTEPGALDGDELITARLADLSHKLATRGIVDPPKHLRELLEKAAERYVEETQGAKPDNTVTLTFDLKTKGCSEIPLDIKYRIVDAIFGLGAVNTAHLGDEDKILLAVHGVTSIALQYPQGAADG